MSLIWAGSISLDSTFQEIVLQGLKKQKIFCKDDLFNFLTYALRKQHISMEKSHKMNIF